MVDRFHIPPKTYPEPSSEGYNGGPPVRDQRRSRALGQNLVKNVDGQLCTYDMGQDAEEAETLVAYIKAYDFAEGAVNGVSIETATDPYEGVASAIVPDPLLQNIEVIAEVQWGHDGVTKKSLMNLPAGQVVKMQAGASYMRAHAKLTARYFARIQLDTLLFTYLNADPNLRNNLFNAIGSPALQADLGFDAGTIPTTPIHVDGVISKGMVSLASGGSNDRSSRPCRRFYGSCPVEGAGYPAGGARIYCPVAFGAAAVMLQTNPAAFTDFEHDPAGKVLSPLQFAMIDHAGNVVGGQVANQFVPLIANCQQILVYNTAANTQENPFALIYDLGL